MKKLLIGLGILVVLALLGLSAAYFMGFVELPVDLAAVSPTPTIVILAPTSEPESAVAETEDNSDTSEPESETAPPDDTETTAETEEEDTTSARPENLPPPTAALSQNEATITTTPTTVPDPTATLTPLPTATTVIVQLVATPEPIAGANAGGSLIPTPSVGNMTGDWDFNFGRMSLRQNSISVSGEFSWYGDINKGRITGSFVYNTNQFKGLWISQINPNEQGFVDWRLINERIFGGSFEDNSLEGQWCGVRVGDPLPDGCGFSGTWNLHFGSPGNVAGRASLAQIGNRVTGSYTAEDGRMGEIVESTVIVYSSTEATLQGTWRNADGATGPFEWRLNQLSNKSFEGRRTDDMSEWCGWREGTEKPDPCGF